MNKLNTEKRAQVIGCLVEGMSIRATVRITGVAKNTISKLLVDLGAACREYQSKVFRNLPCTRIQCDEVWSFCYAKEKNVPNDLKGMFGYGDVWTWTALCADTKLVPSWLVANRSAVPPPVINGPVLCILTDPPEVAGSQFVGGRFASFDHSLMSK